MRFAIPLLVALTALGLVACTGGEDEATAPVPVAQRFVTEEDAPDSKADPVETRQTTVDFDEFVATLSERAVDPDNEEITEAFPEASFESAGVDTRFYGETHTPGQSTHVVSSFIELTSEEEATSALEWLEADVRKPCPGSCAVRTSTFDVDELPGRTRRPLERNSRGHREGRQPRPTALRGLLGGIHQRRNRLYRRPIRTAGVSLRGAGSGDRKRVLRPAYG